MKKVIAFKMDVMHAGIVYSYDEYHTSWRKAKAAARKAMKRGYNVSLLQRILPNRSPEARWNGIQNWQKG